MNFKVPVKNQSQRSSSFYSRKLALPVGSFYDEIEYALSRQSSVTPNTAKNSRALSYVEMKNSPCTPSRSQIHRIFESPKHKIAESSSSKISAGKNHYINELIDKLTNKKENSLKSSEEIKKIEEKYSIKIEALNSEIEKLKNQLKKLKVYRSTEKKKEKALQELTETFEKFKTIIKEFVTNLRLNTQKLHSYMSNIGCKDAVSDINLILNQFNQNLEPLVPFIGNQIIINNRFNIEQNDMQNTGRFRSLGDTQSSFGAPVSGVAVKEVIALADYQPYYYGELPFRLGDRIQLIKTDDPHWWLGKIGEKIGRIPSQLVMLD
jgi:SH3 domain